ncbi:MAG: DUF302 domain-containing protein [Limisphaerales bacterium]
MTAKEYDIERDRIFNGLTAIESDFGPKETMDRLEADIKKEGITVFARINHAALAAEAGLVLHPTELIIFGNPHAGTPLMRVNQTMGIDLPLKALVWEDATGKTWLTYNEPSWLARRHSLGIEAGPTNQIMELTLSAISQKAAKGHAIC